MVKLLWCDAVHGQQWCFLAVILALLGPCRHMVSARRRVLGPVLPQNAPQSLALDAIIERSTREEPFHDGTTASAARALGDQEPVDDAVTQPLPWLQEKTNVTHHAGLITLDSGASDKLFYWHFQAETHADTAPLVIWLNGGPGCSSMEGMLTGVSPLRLDSSKKLKLNPYSWHKVANLLFLDQPVGTGMSNTRGNRFRDSEEEIAKDFYEFLQKFFTRHPEYLANNSSKGGTDASTNSTATRRTSESTARTRTRELFIFGESHAGRFIPQFSELILKQNNDQANFKPQISLVGIGIGNGWVHPMVQYDYSDFAHGVGLVTFGQVRTLKADFVACKEALNEETYFSSTCLRNFDQIVQSAQNGASDGKKLNYYDVRQYVDDMQHYPEERPIMIEYLNDDDVVKAVHGNTASSFRFQGCSDPVYDALKQFDGESSLANVEHLLRSGLQVLFYNGQWDLMCNHYATERLLLELEWDGAGAYQQAQKYTWRVDGKGEPAGFVQQGGNLTYAVVANAGHMVPLNAPAAALDMVTRFLAQKAFEDQRQSISTTKTNGTDLDDMSCDAIQLHPTTQTASKVTTGVLWMAVVVAVVSGLLATCVTAAFMRKRSSPYEGREMVPIENIPQAGDEEEDDEEDEAQAQEEEETAFTDEVTEISLRP